MGGQTRSYADVQLILSPLSAIPAIAQRTRSRSTVKGTGDIARCKLTYALRADDLQAGKHAIIALGGRRCVVASSKKQAAA